jgi:hypothetical protein
MSHFNSYVKLAEGILKSQAHQKTSPEIYSKNILRFWIVMYPMASHYGIPPVPYESHLIPVDPLSSVKTCHIPMFTVNLIFGLLNPHFLYDKLNWTYSPIISYDILTMCPILPSPIVVGHIPWHISNIYRWSVVTYHLGLSENTTTSNGKPI